MATPKKVETCKIQLTIDRGTDRLLEEMISMGIHGTSKSEVAVAIIRSWLWANEEKLRQNGVALVRTPIGKPEDQA